MPLTNRLSFNATARLCRIALRFRRLFLLLVVSLALGAVGNPPEMIAGSTGSVELTAGASIPREVSAGDSQLFEISLAQGQLLRFSIVKSDLALSLVLYD